MKIIENGAVTSPKGFKAARCAAGIKYKDRDDMAMLFSEKPCTSAGVYTTNVVKAACVKWDQKITESSKGVHAVVVNAGIANACTGAEGFEYCKKTADAVAAKMNITADSVCVASTGVIGMQLPIDKLTGGIDMMVPTLADTIDAGHEAARAIMTTDTVPKEIAVEFEVGGKTVTVGAMCKGSGMIHPNMCTMLGFVTTDLCISKDLLQAALSTVVVDTFNMVTVDGDTSTNDTLLVLANGEAGNDMITELNDDYHAFVQVLYTVCEALAKKMASDGEGATHLYEVIVENADNKDDAVTLAKSVCGSSLCKAAIYGKDANCGRFMCALGYSGVEFDPDKVDIYFESAAGSVVVVKDGAAPLFDEELALKILSEEAVTVRCDMKAGDAKATAWGCDLTYDYVKINADYRS